MKGTNLLKGNSIRRVGLPLSVAGLALAVTFWGAYLSGQGPTNVGGINALIHDTTGRSGEFLGGLGLIGFAFTAGMVAAFNP